MARDDAEVVAAEQLGGAARGVGVREPVEAVAAQPALAPLGRQRVGGGRGRQRGVEGGVEAGDGRRSGSARATASIAASALGWCSGARSVSSSRRARTASSIQRRRPKRVAAVHDAVADGVGAPAARRARPRSNGSPPATRPSGRRPCASSSSSSRSLRLLEPALTTSSAAQRRPRPVADVRQVVAVLAGVGAVAQALVDHLLAQRRPRAGRGRARGR